MCAVRRRSVLAAALLACASTASWAEEPSGPLVAAASDLKFALEAIAAAFRHETGVSPRLAFGASGNLTRQIEQGAPFEVFFSADEAFVVRLASRNLTRDEGELYAVGRIVLFAPHGSPLAPDVRLDGLKQLLARGAAWRFAIANPEHAPYGRAAEQALRASGVWEAIRPRLVLGENVSQAAQLASSGDTAGGILSHSFALAPELAAKGRFVLLPATLHQPLRQRMVLLRRAGVPAVRFYEYIRTPRARAVLTRYGFELPAD
jgi:molybdate transport system substrate-binding protein